MGRVAQARLASLKRNSFVQYLLLEESSATLGESHEKSNAQHITHVILSQIQQRNIFEMILDYVIAETSSIVRETLSNAAPKSHHLTTDMLQVALSLATVDYALLSVSFTTSVKRKQDLQQAVDDLMRGIVNTVASQDNHEDLLTGLYDSLAAFPHWAASLDSDQGLLLQGLVRISQTLGPDFWRNAPLNENSNSIEGNDLMDLDDRYSSHTGHQDRVEDGSMIEMPHGELHAATDRAAFKVSQAAKLCFLSQLSFHKDKQALPYALQTTPFAEYLTSLRPHEFLACRYLMQDVFRSDILFEEKDSGLLLGFLTQEIMPVYEFERCEVSMGVCLDIMTAFTEIWTADTSGETPDLGASLYEWFIKIALNRRISSSHVYICISAMLQRVIKIQPDYARSLSLSSARTSLFSVLQEGTLHVKYEVGGQISDIFGLFVLKEHDSIIKDIVSSLPNAADWSEGLAVRIFVLANLGSSWSTLLRKCVYHIFETPGHVPSATGHAQLCLAFMSKKLGLNGPQDLFKLFVPQISYTWLETYTVKSIPYAIFGYAKLANLLTDVQDEIVGQVVMRGKDDEAAELALELGKPYEQLLRESFTKTSAYSMARDIAVPPARATQAPGAEGRLRRTLGKDLYNSLVATNFASILALFYKTLDQEDHIVKGFQKYAGMTQAYVAYDTMKSISSSDSIMPANQQPSFRANFLIDEVEHLCRRTGYEMDSIWSPSLFAITFREIMASIHPALGSLHACAVLRRIRILISMAGPTALSLYPLEMSLHSVRPFLTNSQCSEDAIGIFQYIIREGTPYLKEVPAFLAGIAASTLTSMKLFLGSTQESTTQESQHKATMSKALNFHTWFGTYLDRYTSPILSQVTSESFKTIVRTSRQIRGRGNASKGTYESDLLIELLEDELSESPLLSQTSRDLILTSLVQVFDVPPNFRDDIAGNDEEALKFGSAIWQISQRVNCSREFLLWAARTLGRAFAASGNVNNVMDTRSESAVDQHEGNISSSSPLSASRSAILDSICDTLFTDNLIEVEIAEKTMRAILGRAQATEHLRQCEDLLPTALVKSMAWDQDSPFLREINLFEVLSSAKASGSMNKSRLQHQYL